MKSVISDKVVVTWVCSSVPWLLAVFYDPALFSNNHHIPHHDTWHELLQKVKVESVLSNYVGYLLQGVESFQPFNSTHRVYL